VLGVEKKQKPVGEGKMVDVWVMNLLLGGGAIRPVDLEQVAEIKLDDPKLQQELIKALAAVAASRDQDKKPVTLRFNGQGQRRVRIGYVVEAPVWKASYRLVLSANAKNEDAGTGGRGDAEKGKDKGAAGQAVKDKEENAAGGKGDGGKLLGWAIVENQTDNDWEGVQLSLVSGRPISFIEDLYQPLYVPRPVVQPELYASLRPQTYAAGLEDQLMRKAGPRTNPKEGAHLDCNARKSGITIKACSAAAAPADPLVPSTPPRRCRRSRRAQRWASCFNTPCRMFPSRARSRR
jgi:hypothetical protein